MKKISVRIDQLTNSIINRISGDIFQTEFYPASEEELEMLENWKFNWKKEKQKSSVFKMVIQNNINIIQGLIGLQDKKDHIFVSLVENAPFNIGKNGLYQGVGGNLFAYACLFSFKNNYDGYVAFEPKTSLIEHYQKMLGATVLSKSRMIIEPFASTNLVKQYFKS